MYSHLGLELHFLVRLSAGKMAARRKSFNVSHLTLLLSHDFGYSEYHMLGAYLGARSI